MIESTSPAVRKPAENPSLFALTARINPVTPAATSKKGIGKNMATRPNTKDAVALLLPGLSPGEDC